MLALILVIGAIVSLAWAPETKGLTLVDAAHDPAHLANHAAAWANHDVDVRGVNAVTFKPFSGQLVHRHLQLGEPRLKRYR